MGKASSVFLASFTCDRDPVDYHVHRVVLAPAGPKAEGNAVPFHKAEEKPGADCYLQVWELDYYNTNRHFNEKGQKVGTTRPWPESMTNRGWLKNKLLKAFPGAVLLDAASKRYVFRTTETPAAPPAKYDLVKGRVLIGIPLLADGKEAVFTLPLAEYEAELELAAVVSTQEKDEAYAYDEEQDAKRSKEKKKPPKRVIIPPYQVRNVTGSLWQQIAERGGIAIACVADYTGTHEYAAGNKFKKIYEQENQWNNHPNNLEFRREAEGQLNILPTFVKAEEDGKGVLKMGYYEIGGYTEIPGKIDEIRLAAKGMLDESRPLGAKVPNDPGAGKPPPIAMLALYAHGIPTGLDIERSEFRDEASARAKAGSKWDGEKKKGCVAKALEETKKKVRAEITAAVKKEQPAASADEVTAEVDRRMRTAAVQQQIKDEAETLAEANCTAQRQAYVNEQWHGFEGEVIGRYGDAGDLTKGKVAGFVASLAGKLAPRVVMPLFACNTGSRDYGGDENHDQGRFALEGICEPLGLYGFAWTLQQELRKSGCAATVWGHTTAAHCTINWAMRVFCDSGSANFPSFMIKGRRATATSIGGYKTRFANLAQNASGTNILKAMQFQDGRYLPWEWNGGAALDESKLNAYEVEALRRVEWLLEKARAWASGVRKDTADVTYTPDRAFITGLAAGTRDIMLLDDKAGSRHKGWTFADFNAVERDGRPMRISVRLLAGLHVLLIGRSAEVTFEKIADDGRALWLACDPNTPANLQKLLQAATWCRGQGLFTEAALIDSSGAPAAMPTTGRTVERCVRVAWAPAP